MKISLFFLAGLALAISSNAPANAGPLMTRCWMSSNIPKDTVPSTGGLCPKIAATYAECQRVAHERGWDSTSSFYACGTMGYKN